VRRLVVPGICGLLIVAGCASTGPSSASPSSAPSASLTIPAASTAQYASTAFLPRITFPFPAGWTTDFDESAEWRILPPGSTHAGAEDGTSDAIALHVRIAASAADCSGVPQPGVGQTPTDIATYWAQLPGLTTTAPQPVTVGGLTGVVLDIGMAKSWTKPCPYSGGKPTVPLIVGLTNTDLDHPIDAGSSIRVYLLGLNGGTLAIEVQDVTGGSHFTEYGAIVQTFQFKQ
jgi:hypothetical protein